MKLLVIDNYDSFLYNLVYELQNLAQKITVVRNDIDYLGLQAQIDKHDAIVISPGPGKPSESGHCIKVIKEYFKTKPILGICLGHQAIIEAFDGKVTRAKSIVHGKVSSIIHGNKGLFYGVDKCLNVARYHSLSGQEIPNQLTIDAVTDMPTDEAEIMAVSHKEYPVFGFQFHPESIMTQKGNKLLENFINKVKLHTSTRGKNNVAAA